MNTNCRFPWYVIAVRSNHERSASTSLCDKGYEVFLPTYRAQRRWSDRSKEVERPLFPGYTFCRFDPQRRLPILQSPGVMSILGTHGNGPLPVDEAEIDAVRAIVRSDVPAGPWPFVREGAFVTVERGPLAGVEGRVIEVKSKCRLVVSVSLLQRSIAAEIDRDWVVRRGAVSSHGVAQFSHGLRVQPV